VARNTESIERDIEAARNQLATTLDDLAVKVDPQRLVDETKHAVLTTVKQPKVLIPGAIVGGGIALLVLRGVFRAIFRR
jgi:hypothetical protein